MTFKIYKGDSVIAEGESPLSITGVNPNTNVAAGDYKAVKVDGQRESEKVDIPAFKTLPIAVTGVTIAPKTASVEVGKTQQATGTVSPGNATNKAVTYTSSNETAATVNASGLITAKAEGTTNIVVNSADGNKKDTCVVTVTAAPEA